MDEDTKLQDKNNQADKSPFQSVPIEVTVTVGKAHPTIKELLGLKQNAVLALDKQIDDPVELVVGNQLIACGHLEEISDGVNAGKLAIRLTEIIDSKFMFS